MDEIGGLETADALRFANLRRSDWNNSVGRGLYTEPPVASSGRARIFDMDDLVAAYVLGLLFEREVLPKFACEIAVGVRRELRKSDNVTILCAWKVPSKKGQPRVVVAQAAPASEATELFRFQVKRIRARARADIEAKQAAIESKHWERGDGS